MSHPLVVVTGWPSGSLTGDVWSMNVFRDVDSSLDDDIQGYVEPLVASFQPEAVDVSPAVGLDGQGYLGQHHELHRAGELELRRPGGRPALAGRTGGFQESAKASGAPFRWPATTGRRERKEPS